MQHHRSRNWLSLGIRHGLEGALVVLVACSYATLLLLHTPDMIWNLLLVNSN